MSAEHGCQQLLVPGLPCLYLRHLVNCAGLHTCLEWTWDVEPGRRALMGIFTMVWFWGRPLRRSWASRESRDEPEQICMWWGNSDATDGLGRDPSPPDNFPPTLGWRWVQDPGKLPCWGTPCSNLLTKASFRSPRLFLFEAHPALWIAPHGSGVILELFFHGVLAKWLWTVTPCICAVCA